MRITPGQQCWMAGASRKGGVGRSSLGLDIRGNPVHPGMMMVVVVVVNSTSEGSWAHRGWSWWSIWPWYWPSAGCWCLYRPWCCLYDDVVDHVNAGGDDVKVGMEERGRVESTELERGNPGTSGLHPIHTRTLACVAFVTNIFMDVPTICVEWWSKA